MGLAPYGTPKGLLDGLVDVASSTMRIDLLGKRAPFPESFIKVAGPPDVRASPWSSDTKILVPTSSG